MPALACIGTATYIFYQSNIKHAVLEGSSLNKWKEQYELKYKRFENLPHPSITSVITSVDLFPEKQSYNVNGQYVLINKTNAGIDSILIYFDRITKMNGLQIAGASMVFTDSDFGHYWMLLQNTLVPGDSVVMDFNFNSSWSSFNEHVPFNSIVNNGSFSRISNFFPKIYNKH